MASIEIKSRKVSYRNHVEYTNDIVVNGEVVVRAVSEKMAKTLVENFGKTWGRIYS